ncbi:MAG: glycosyltransferase family 2 protein [Chthonomonadales bacterium]
MASALLLLIPILRWLLFAVIGSVWLFWATCALYLVVLLFAAIIARRDSSPFLDPKNRFCLLIPAHNEELILGEVLDRLQQVEYPRDLWTVFVIADNCTDSTADVAKTHGAEPMVRNNPDEIGKGYALDWAIQQLLVDKRNFNAFLILDADSILSPNFLHVMNRAIEKGSVAMQGYYGVLNVHDSWRTKLMAVALALAHYVKPIGRRTLGLSDGLKGNGMCFTREALTRVPWSGESVTEDIEYTLRLVDAGIRIDFLPQAIVQAQMPTTGKQATTQRQRWEGGRYGLFKRAIGSAMKFFSRGKWMQFDRSFELIIPPFVEMFALPVVIAGALGIWTAMRPGSPTVNLLLAGWLSVLALELVYLVGGLVVARVPMSVASSLLFAPFYILWKIVVVIAVLLKKGTGGWNRTERRSL